MTFFIVTAVKTSNLTTSSLNRSYILKQLFDMTPFPPGALTTIVYVCIFLRDILVTVDQYVDHLWITRLMSNYTRQQRTPQNVLFCGHAVTFADVISDLHHVVILIRLPAAVDEGLITLQSVAGRTLYAAMCQESNTDLPACSR
jgi:hypothetical protein